MIKSTDILFTLLRSAFGTPQVDCDLSKVSGREWQEIIGSSFEQGVASLCVDGYDALLETFRPHTPGTLGTVLETGELEDLRLEWYGSVLSDEESYALRWKVARELSDLWDTAGIRATVLKGQSIAQYYPKPNHRYSCDVDVYIPSGGPWELACELLKTKGITLEYEVYKEVEFTYRGVYVECHRYITPVRGNKNLLDFEQYLRSLLVTNPPVCFEDSKLLNPPMMFTAMLFIEHALGDLLHGKMLLKHVADWIVLRRQLTTDDLATKCREFRFDRFLNLINVLADVVEGKKDISDIPDSYQEVFEEILRPHAESRTGKTWFQRRVTLFFEIIRNRKMYQNFGYCSMERFLFTSVWAHFFRKEVTAWSE